MNTHRHEVVRSQDFEQYVPYRVTTASDDLGWRGFRTEIVRGHAPGEINLPPLDHHLLNLILSVPNRHVHAWDGVSREEIGQVGAASLVPAGRDSYWRWNYLEPGVPCDFHVHLQPLFVRRVALASFAELPPDVELQGELCFNDPQLHQLASALLTEMETGGRNGPLYAESIATALVTVLLTRQEPWRRGFAGPAVGLEQIRTVCDYVESNLGAELHLEVLAAFAGLGPERLRQDFRSLLGETPHRFVLRRRLERAREMLRCTSIPITEVALRLGFADHSHFTATFRRELGLTPSRFRDQSRR